MNILGFDFTIKHPEEWQPTSYSKLDALKEGGISWSEILPATFYGVTSAFETGIKGTTEAIQRIPESVTAPFKLIQQAQNEVSKGIGITGLIILTLTGLYLLKKK